MNFFKHFPKIVYNYQLGNNENANILSTDLFRLVKFREEFRNWKSYYKDYFIQNGERPDQVSYNLYGTPDYYWTFFLANPNLKNLFHDWPLSQSEFDEYINSKYKDYRIDINRKQDISNKFNIGENVKGLISGAIGEILEINSQQGWIRIKKIKGKFKNQEIILGQISNDRAQTAGFGKMAYAAHHYEVVNLINKEVMVVNRDYPLAEPVTFFEEEKRINDDKSLIKVIIPELIDELVEEYQKKLVIKHEGYRRF